MRIAIAAACGLAALTATVVLQREGAGPAPVARASSASSGLADGHVANPFQARASRASARQGAAQPVSSPPVEPLPVSDTTGLLQPPLALDELLDALNADLGAEATPVDRDQLAALLRADPELNEANGK